ncbi:uncharacterized protein A4U43_C03F22360 [Asparagus officinalis]|uniref:Uncharacterized protein n=1 Tax=Asparagus officinalis TaxID=4686 RepID=A0A5P1FGF7_ASPOF|nr:uncharacterized protein A4U43_C03F22360 [Asparagus officinalis]
MRALVLRKAEEEDEGNIGEEDDRKKEEEVNMDLFGLWRSEASLGKEEKELHQRGDERKPLEMMRLRGRRGEGGEVAERGGNHDRR